MLIKPPPVELNIEYIRSLGHVLRKIRTRSCVSIVSLEDKLLLSKEQIEGIENFVLDRFYGNRHFAQAFVKYANHLKIPVDRNKLTVSGQLIVGVLEI